MMKTINKFLSLAVVLGSIACVAVTVSDKEVDYTQTISLGTIPASPVPIPADVSYPVSLPPQSVPLDISSPLSKITSVADNLKVSIQSLSISNTKHNLDWLSSVSVSIQTVDNSLPPASFATGTYATPTIDMSLTVVMPDSVALTYLQKPCTLVFTISGQVTSALAGTDLTDDVSMSVSVSADVNKSL